MFITYKMKKYGALILNVFFPMIALIVGYMFYGFIISLIVMSVVSVLTIICATLLLSHPFRDMIEGSGLLVLDITSTGILRPFLVKVNPPNIWGNLAGKQIKGFWNRELAVNMAKPVKAGKATLKEKGGIQIDMTEKEYNKGRMAMLHYPILIYNSAVKSFITKDMISEMEMKTFSEYQITLLNHQQEDLSSNLKHFSRSVIDQLRPKFQLGKGAVAGIVIVIILIIFGILFLPKIAPQIMNIFSGGAEAIGNVAEAVPKDTITAR